MSETKAKRGRPRTFDAGKVLARARDKFWDSGFSATSLDTLGEAMAMNRPSLYNAFGDKEDLYLQTLAQYRDDSLVALTEALDPSRSLADGLRAVYAKSLAIYFSGDISARGCFLIGTAATEAVASEPVRQVLGESLIAFDRAIEARIRLAQESGEIAAGADPETLARLASAVMHSLAIRARAGEPRAALEALAEGGVRLICGS
jgi:AcrR family transcriptional regulator